MGTNQPSKLLGQKKQNNNNKTVGKVKIKRNHVSKFHIQTNQQVDNNPHPNRDLTCRSKV